MTATLAETSSPSTRPPAPSRRHRRPDPPVREPASWDRLVSRYRRRLAGVARRALARCGAPSSPDRVEDLVQEVWCRLLERGGRPQELRGDGRTFAYLARTTRNLAIDRVRAARAVKRGRGWLRDEGHRDDDEGPAVVETLRDRAAPTPEDELLRRERRHRARAVLASLVKDRQRRHRDAGILELALLDGWTSRQISAALGGRLTASSIDSLVHRARRALRRRGVELPSRRRAL